MGLYTMVSVGVMPLGALFWSFISRTRGLPCALSLIGGGLLLLGCLFFLFPLKKIKP